jgi:hypothetical protein
MADIRTPPHIKRKHSPLARVIWGSAEAGVIAMFVIGSLQFAGVIKVGLAYLCLVVAWLVLVLGVWFTERTIGWKLRHRLLTTGAVAVMGGVVALTIGRFEWSAQASTVATVPRTPPPPVLTKVTHVKLRTVRRARHAPTSHLQPVVDAIRSPSGDNCTTNGGSNAGIQIYNCPTIK